jgi:hypothetical protein
MSGKVKSGESAGISITQERKVKCVRDSVSGTGHFENPGVPWKITLKLTTQKHVVKVCA